MTFGEYVKGGAQKIKDKQREMRLYAYYRQIMEEDNCSMEEAVRSTFEYPTHRIGVKMIDYGLFNLSTKKGRKRFGETQLTAEEKLIWDSPERPDNLVRLAKDAGVIMTENGMTMVKEVFKREKR